MEVQHSMNDQMVLDVTIPDDKHNISSFNRLLMEKGESYGYTANRDPLAHPLAGQSSTNAR